jgi:transcription initiation factor TFIIH subunit 4
MLAVPPAEAAVAGKRLLITAKGYEYMLKDYYQQIWEYVINRLFNSESYEDCMSLLFLLSYTEFGRPYTTDILNKTQKLMLFELSQVGIVYIPDYTGNIFYPTKVAINIVFGYQSAQHLSSVSGAAKSVVASRYTLNRSSMKGVDITKVINPHETDKGVSGPSHGRAVGNEVISVQNASGGSEVDSSLSNDQLLVIVETNLQVVAYVKNDLYFALLRLFVEVAVRLPNMVMGRLSRDKAKLAYRMGMKSSQIIDFLIVHAHPVMKARNNLSSSSKATAILPDNVIDQLILWESELSRIQTKDALSIDLKNLVTMQPEQYQQLMNKLNALNLVFWENREDRCFVCDPNAQMIVENFLRDHGLHFLS